MPLPYVRKVAKSKGISVARSEAKWADAKAAAKRQYGDLAKSNPDKFYAITTAIYKKMSHVKESIMSKRHLVTLHDYSGDEDHDDVRDRIRKARDTAELHGAKHHQTVKHGSSHYTHAISFSKKSNADSFVNSYKTPGKDNYKATHGASIKESTMTLPAIIEMSITQHLKHAARLKKAGKHDKAQAHIQQAKRIGKLYGVDTSAFRMKESVKNESANCAARMYKLKKLAKKHKGNQAKLDKIHNAIGKVKAKALKESDKKHTHVAVLHVYDDEHGEYGDSVASKVGGKVIKYARTKYPDVRHLHVSIPSHVTTKHLKAASDKASKEGTIPFDVASRRRLKESMTERSDDMKIHGVQVKNKIAMQVATRSHFKALVHGHLAQHATGDQAAKHQDLAHQHLDHADRHIETAIGSHNEIDKEHAHQLAKARAHQLFQAHLRKLESKKEANVKLSEVVAAIQAGKLTPAEGARKIAERLKPFASEPFRAWGKRGYERNNLPLKPGMGESCEGDADDGDTVSLGGKTYTMRKGKWCVGGKCVKVGSPLCHKLDKMAGKDDANEAQMKSGMSRLYRMRKLASHAIVLNGKHLYHGNKDSCRNVLHHVKTKSKEAWAKYSGAKIEKLGESFKRQEKVAHKETVTGPKRKPMKPMKGVKEGDATNESDSGVHDDKVISLRHKLIKAAFKKGLNKTHRLPDSAGSYDHGDHAYDIDSKNNYDDHPPQTVHFHNEPSEVHKNRVSKASSHSGWVSTGYSDASHSVRHNGTPLSIAKAVTKSKAMYHKYINKHGRQDESLEGVKEGLEEMSENMKTTNRFRYYAAHRHASVMPEPYMGRHIHSIVTSGKRPHIDKAVESFAKKHGYKKVSLWDDTRYVKSHKGRDAWRTIRAIGTKLKSHLKGMHESLEERAKPFASEPWARTRTRAFGKAIPLFVPDFEAKTTQNGKSILMSKDALESAWVLADLNGHEYLYEDRKVGPCDLLIVSEGEGFVAMSAKGLHTVAEGKDVRKIVERIAKKAKQECAVHAVTVEGELVKVADIKGKK